jgi:hypothetical protein
VAKILSMSLNFYFISIIMCKIKKYIKIGKEKTDYF